MTRRQRLDLLIERLQSGLPWPLDFTCGWLWPEGDPVWVHPENHPRWLPVEEGLAPG